MTSFFYKIIKAQVKSLCSDMTIFKEVTLHMIRRKIIYNNNFFNLKLFIPLQRFGFILYKSQVPLLNTKYKSSILTGDKQYNSYNLNESICMTRKHKMFMLLLDTKLFWLKMGNNMKFGARFGKFKKERRKRWREEYLSWSFPQKNHRNRPTFSRYAH